MVTNNLIGIIFFAIFFYSCSNGKNKDPLTEINESAQKNLALKYNAITNWDSTFQYTAYYQEDFIEAKKLMLFKGRIYDIEKKDSSYIIKILDERTDSPINFLAVVSCNEQQYDKVFDENTSDRGAFVIQITKIASSNPSIKVTEEEDEDGSYTYNHLSDDKDHMISMFYGKLIDFYLDMIKNK